MTAASLQAFVADWNFKVEQYAGLADAAAQQPRLAAGLAAGGVLECMLDDAQLLVEKAGGGLEELTLVKRVPCPACGLLLTSASVPAIIHSLTHGDELRRVHAGCGVRRPVHRGFGRAACGGSWPRC